MRRLLRARHQRCPLYLEVKTRDTAVGTGPSLNSSRRLQRGLSGACRQAHGRRGNVQAQGRPDGMQPALRRQSFRSGRIGTMDRAEAFRIACLVSKGGGTNREPLLPQKQTRRQGSLRVA